MSGLVERLRELPWAWRFRRFRRRHREMRRAVPGIGAAIEAVDERWSPRADRSERPIFLLSGGWRSGSTLLQRLVMSSGRCMIWGEAFARCALVQRLAKSLLPLGADYPPDDYFLASREGRNGADLSKTWIANLFPAVGDLKAAHRALFDRLYGAPASDLGYDRWGLKEVRLSAGHARYLRWLYPEARLVFLVRDPAAAYRSYRAMGPGFDRWPERAVIGPEEFGRHWVRTASGFVEQAESLDARLVRFEDLVSREDGLISELAAYLELELRPETFDRRVAGRGPRTRPSDVPLGERRALARVVGDVAGRLGYDDRPV